MTPLYTHLGQEDRGIVSVDSRAWMHSACDKVDFLSPWQALQDAEDLAVDVGFGTAFRTEVFLYDQAEAQASPNFFF